MVVHKTTQKPPDRHERLQNQHHYGERQEQAEDNGHYLHTERRGLGDVPYVEIAERAEQVTDRVENCTGLRDGECAGEDKECENGPAGRDRPSGGEQTDPQAQEAHHENRILQVGEDSDLRADPPDHQELQVQTEHADPEDRQVRASLPFR